MVCSRQSIRWLTEVDCEDHVVPPVKFLEPCDSNQSAASLTLHENDAVHVQLTSATNASSSNREEERPPEPITGFGSRAGTTNCDASGLGGFVRRYLSTRNLRITSNFFRCTMYLVSHSVLCHRLVKQHSRNDKKKKKKKKKKDCQMSVYHKADPGELIQWVTHESWSSAASNSGLIRIGTQPRTADALHQWLMPAARRRHPRFFGHFDRLFDRLPVRISTSDLHHWILRKKIFHIRAYDFGVQFSFKASLSTTSRLVPSPWATPTRFLFGRQKEDALCAWALREYRFCSFRWFSVQFFAFETNSELYFGLKY